MRILRSIADKVRLRMLLRDEYESVELRSWFKTRFGVEVGLYSYGCFDQWRIPRRTRIGRYCSFAKSSRVLDANHPLDALTTHPFLYERRFGVVTEDLIDPDWITIEDGVWVSHNATITPGCKHVGRGAVIGAGAIVTKDVPAYAVVAGAPARIVRYRFPPEVQALVEETRWWELDKEAFARRYNADPQAFLKPDVDNLKAWIGA